MDKMIGNDPSKEKVERIKVKVLGYQENRAINNWFCAVSESDKVQYAETDL